MRLALFERDYRVLIGRPGQEGHEIRPPFHITFDIKKDREQNPNTGNLSIWNLSKEKRRAYEEPDMHLILYAGYLQDTGATLLASGEVTSAFSEKKEADIVTDIEFNDGWLAIRDTAVSLSYGSGVRASTVIHDTASQMGLTLDMSGVPDRSWQNGFSFYGAAHEVLSKATRGTGLEWSIQNGKLRVLEKGEAKVGTGFVLNANSGLIGSPTRMRKGAQEKAVVKDQRTGDNKEIVSSKQQQDGWRVRSLLIPSLEPGDRVKVESSSLDGWFRIESVRHTGDWGDSGDWVSELEVVE